MSSLTVVDPVPKILVEPPGVVDFGEADAAIELWEHYSGKRLDETQRLVVRVLMAQGPGGKWAAATTGREMPRQNGKGDEIEVVELWGLVQRGEAILHTVHDAVLLATQTQQRMLGVLEGHADLRRLVKRKWQGTGQQMIEMRNGGVIWYRTRTGGGGRGVDDVDRLVVDEAQHATEEHLAAVSPTLLANPNPQLNALGTAGIAGGSEWWWRLRIRALSAQPGALGYVGHTAETVRVDGEGRVTQEPVDVNDRALWLAANPAIGSGRGGGMAFLEEQLLRLGPAMFAREHLGVWDPPPGELAETVPSVFDMDRWPLLVGKPPGGPITWGVKFSPDGRSVALGAAIRPDDGPVHVQGVRHELVADGTAWLVDWVLANPGTVVVDGKAGAGGFVAALAREKVPAKRVKRPTVDEVIAAHAGFAEGIRDGGLSHLGDPVLSEAVEASVRRPIGASGGWGITGREGEDVSLVEAVVLAHWGAMSKRRPSGRPGGRRAVVLS